MACRWEVTFVLDAKDAGDANKWQHMFPMGAREQNSVWVISSFQFRPTGGVIGVALSGLPTRVRQNGAFACPSGKWDLVLPEQLQWCEGTWVSCMREHVPGHHTSRRLATVNL